MAAYIINSQLNSNFRTISNGTALKMTAKARKAVGKTQTCVSVRNNLTCGDGGARLQNFEFFAFKQVSFPQLE